MFINCTVWTTESYQIQTSVNNNLQIRTNYHYKLRMTDTFVEYTIQQMNKEPFSKGMKLAVLDFLKLG